MRDANFFYGVIDFKIWTSFSIFDFWTLKMSKNEIPKKVFEKKKI
jgi:hypothetical protein